MMKTNDISPAVQSHLSRVYAALVAGVLLGVVGVYVQMWTHVSGMLTHLATMGVLVWLLSSGGMPVEKRLSLFAAFSVLEGVSIGGLVELALFIKPSVVVVAFAATAAVFVCFSLAALLSKRRSMLYLGGALSSLLTVLFFAGLLNFFVGSTLIFNVQLYVGLAMFLGYVVYDTQVIVEMASLGDRDYIGHACKLLIDFVGMFVRILIILLKNAKKVERKR